MGDGPHLYTPANPRRTRTRPSRRFRRSLLIGTVGVLLSVIAPLITTACSGAGGSDDAASVGRSEAAEAPSDGSRQYGSPRAATDGDLDGDNDGDAAAVKAGSVEAATAAEGRDRVYTASLEMEVDVLEDSVERASAAVESNGGFTATEQVDLGSAQVATVTYRVPADRFRQSVEAITAVGDLQSQQVEGIDVTAEYADLEGRVTTLRTSIARLQGFLGEATDANQIALFEAELTSREAELESTEAQRRALADQIELSTITVSFTGSRAAAPVDDSRNLPTFLGGLETGWDILVAVGAFTLSALGVLAPFVPLVAISALLVRWGWRRHRAVSV